jgi:hypothetical protein
VSGAARPAAALFIRPGTVKKHLEHIFDKLGVNNRTAASIRTRREITGSPVTGEHSDHPDGRNNGGIGRCAAP